MRQGEAAAREGGGSGHPLDMQPLHARSCSWWWLGGLACIGVGNALDFVSLGITKQSVVTLVGSWSLVCNTLLATYMLGEPSSRLDYLSAWTIIAGIVITVTGPSDGLDCLSYRFRSGLLS